MHVMLVPTDIPEPPMRAEVLIPLYSGIWADDQSLKSFA